MRLHTAHRLLRAYKPDGVLLVQVHRVLLSHMQQVQSGCCTQACSEQ